MDQFILIQIIYLLILNWTYKMDFQIYFLITPVRAAFKSRALQGMTPVIKICSYYFELNVIKDKEIETIGTTTNFEVNNAQQEINKVHKLQLDTSMQQLIHHFPINKNIIELKDSRQGIRTSKFAWAVYCQMDDGIKKKCLKTFSTEFNLSETLKKFQEDSTNYKFKQSIFFGKQQIELIFKTFLLDSPKQILKVKRKIINQETDQLMRSNSMEYIRDDFRSTHIRKTYKQCKIQKPENNLELRREQQLPIKNNRKLLKVKKMMTLLTERNQQKSMCQTVSISIPSAPQHRFTTKQEEDEFNEKVESFLSIHKGSQTFKITPKTLVIFFLVMILFYFISMEIYEQFLQDNDKRKGNKKRRAKKRREQSKNKREQSKTKKKINKK